MQLEEINTHGIEENGSDIYKYDRFYYMRDTYGSYLIYGFRYAKYGTYVNNITREGPDNNMERLLKEPIDRNEIILRSREKNIGPLCRILLKFGSVGEVDKIHSDLIYRVNEYRRMQLIQTLNSIGKKHL